MSFPIREGHTISVAGKGVLFLYPLIGQAACMPLSAEGLPGRETIKRKGVIECQTKEIKALLP